MIRVIICSMVLCQIMQSEAWRRRRTRRRKMRSSMPRSMRSKANEPECNCGEPPTLPAGERIGSGQWAFRSGSSGGNLDGAGVREFWEKKIADGDIAELPKIRGKRSTPVKKTVESEDKIVNGYVVDTQPWLASLFHLQYKMIYCGGALINRRYVL